MTLKLYEVSEQLPDGRERIVLHPQTARQYMTLQETDATVRVARWAVVIREMTPERTMT